jgi:hypothetical protein
MAGADAEATEQLKRLLVDITAVLPRTTATYPRELRQ